MNLKDNCKRQFKPKGNNQFELARSIAENDMVFCHGPAGSGKTAVSVGLAIDYLLQGKIGKIIICRPTLGTLGEKGSEVGFLPGSLLEKVNPFIQNIYDEFYTYFSKDVVDDLINDNILEVVPMFYCRGRTFHDSFIIVDEAQNATHLELKAITTRLGSRSKMVINGDLEQSDLRSKENYLANWVNFIVKDDLKIPVVQLEVVDVVRHELVKHIIYKVREYERNQAQ